jgi:hypothetical protein
MRDTPNWVGCCCRPRRPPTVSAATASVGSCRWARKHARRVTACEVGRLGESGAYSPFLVSSPGEADGFRVPNKRRPRVAVDHVPCRTWHTRARAQHVSGRQGRDGRGGGAACSRWSCDWGSAAAERGRTFGRQHHECGDAHDSELAHQAFTEAALVVGHGYPGHLAIVFLSGGSSSARQRGSVFAVGPRPCASTCRPAMK